MIPENTQNQEGDHVPGIHVRRSIEAPCPSTNASLLSKGHAEAKRPTFDFS